MDEWQKEKVIKISLTLAAIILIILVWFLTLRYNLQGGFKRPNFGRRVTSTSTSTELETNIKTIRQQLSTSWRLLREMLQKK